MSVAATIRVMPAEQIAAQAGGDTPLLLFPNADTVFAERAMRLRQLAPGHAMGDFLAFMAELALAQQRLAPAGASLPLPDDAELDRAARLGVPPLPAADWPRPAAWREAARALAAAMAAFAPAATKSCLDAMVASSDQWLERQADCLLTGVTQGLELATSAIVAAALQATWVRLVDAVRHGPRTGGPAFGRVDDPLRCPCCGSRPVVSITRFEGAATGQRYLACSLCATMWHLARGRCTHCGHDRHITYQSLASAGDAADDATRTRAARAAVQAETCDDCHHYLKILHSDREPLVDAVADDLATITLDLLVADSGLQRHGVNLMLLFGPPDPPPAGAP